MADEMSGAREALYTAIAKAAKDSEDYPPNVAGPALRDLAWAWRAVVGGTQPGVAVIEK